MIATYQMKFNYGNHNKIDRGARMVGIIVLLGVLNLIMMTTLFKEAQGRPISTKNILFTLALVIMVGFIYFCKNIYLK